MQQYLPLAVLKLIISHLRCRHRSVATVLTACGIETISIPGMIGGALNMLQQYLPLAVLKPIANLRLVINCEALLQQYLPLAVLKLNPILTYSYSISMLQQYLPLAVLKP